MSAATYIATSWTSISSLDTGRIGFVGAWGGSEDGYAYTYTASGLPGLGITMGANSGLLTFASPVAAGNYTLTVVATNRESGETASFGVPINVLAGVTSGRSGTAVLHKTYDPHSGAFGTPTGSDWTAVLNAIKAAILADQASNIASDGVETQLRATIPFHKGVTYNYTDNHWLNGVQYYDVTATGSGANPVLQNNSASATFYEAGPLNIGNSGSMNRGGSRKANSVLINTVGKGSSSVVCTTHAQTSRLLPGRWHCVFGQPIQVGGEPPNLMFCEYVRVLTVNPSTGLVTFDRPLRYDYDSTWFEFISDDASFGRAWIWPADTDSNGRMTLRGRWTGIDFAANPNATGPDPKNIMLLQSHLQSDFDTCNLQNFQPTMGKHYSLYTSAILAPCEPDKLSEVLFFSNTTTGVIGGCTGFAYVLGLNSTFNNDGANAITVQISPRQARFSGCTFDAKASTTPPYTFAFNGPNWFLDFQNTIFKGTVGNSWTYTGNSFATLIIGTDATWNGNQLRIPASFTNFEHWLINSYKGAIVAASGLGPVTTNWGYINSVTSDGAGTALWLNIVWVNGTKPTSGTIDIVGGRMRRLNIKSDCTFTAPMTYTDAKFAKQTAAPFQTNWDFPSGSPLLVTSMPGALDQAAVNVAATIKGQSQATAVGTVTGGSLITSGASALSVSKASAVLTQTGSGGGGGGGGNTIVLTLTAATGHFP